MGKPAKVRFKGRPPMLSTSGLNAFQCIQLFYTNPGRVELSETNEDIRKRLLLVYMESLAFLPDLEIVEKLKDLHAVSESQAYQDIQSSRRLFGDIKTTNKESEKHFLLQAYKTAMNAALNPVNIEMISLMGKRMENLLGVNQPDDQAIDFTKLEAHTIKYVYTKEELEDLKEQMVEDIDFEDLSENN